MSDQLFVWFPHLNEIIFQTVHFRKLMHNNGLGWIMAINRVKNSSSSSSRTARRPTKKTTQQVNYSDVAFISLSCEVLIREESMSDVFPDEDFCLYADFPFDQHVFIYQFCFESILFEKMRRLNPSFSCTYLWITSRIHTLAGFYANDSIEFENIKVVLDSRSKFARCEFNRRRDLCNRNESTTITNNIWSQSDFFILNKKIEIFLKVSTHLVALLGIVTNVLVVAVIFGKCNRELFKDSRHYTYLGISSIFSIAIMFVEIVSWISDCFYPFEVFCPRVRQSIGAQLFKMIFKECLVSVSRFMCNFCYVAFALTRIGLIRKCQNSFVEFISQVKVSR